MVVKDWIDARLGITVQRIMIITYKILISNEKVRLTTLQLTYDKQQVEK